jgi:hypothetical protein
MLQDVYKLEGKYPDPHEIKDRLTKLLKNSSLKDEYIKTLKEVKSSGLSSHPLLRRFFVES